MTSDRRRLVATFLIVALARSVFATADDATPRRRPAPPLPAPTEPPPPEPPSQSEEPTGFARAGAGPEVFPPSRSCHPGSLARGVAALRAYPGTAHEVPYVRGHWWDPYNLSVLKATTPSSAAHLLRLHGAERHPPRGRRLPTPSDVSSARPDSAGFFGRGEQFFFEQNFRLSVELFHGNAAFKPRDWELRATPVFNVNYLRTEGNGVVNIDPRRGTDRLDGHVALQELFRRSQARRRQPLL